MAKKLIKGKPPLPPKPKTGELGTSGMIFNGIVINRDYNSKLTGTARIKRYDEMRLGDATVKASLLAMKLPILSARWRIESVSEKRADQQVADFVRDELFDNGTRTWAETLYEILLYLDYGVMPFEIVWEFREVEEQIGLRKLSSRWPDTIFKWEMENGKAGILQQTTSKKVSIPIEKLLIFVNQKEGDNWEGISILRSAYKPWYMKDKYYLIDAIAQERQGLGVPYAKSTGLANDTDESKVEEILKNIRANETAYMMYPAGWELGFMDMKAGTIKNPKPMIDHHDRQISKNVLAQFLELGTGTGSYALSRDQSELFILSLESVANYITSNVNKYLIEKLVDFNFIVDKYPKLTFDKIGTVDINNLTTSLQRALQTKLITPDAGLEDHLRDVMDLPEFTGEVEIDLGMADEILGELDMDLNAVMADEGMAPLPGSAELVPPEDMSDKEMLTAAEEAGIDTTEIATTIFKGAPISEETRKKISEALKRYWSTRKKTKDSKGKGRKKADPEVKKRRKAIRDLRKKVRNFNADVKRELLEMKAKGIKLSSQDQAKKQLEIFERKEKFRKMIEKLQDEIQSFKDANEPQEQKPPEDDPKASEVGKVLERVNSTIDAYERKNSKKSK